MNIKKISQKSPHNRYLKFTFFCWVATVIPNVLGSIIASQSLFLTKKKKCLSDSLSLLHGWLHASLRLLLFFCVSFLLLVLYVKNNRGWDEREKPWDTERKSKRSKREGERERSGVWENETGRERCRRRGRSLEPANPEEPIGGSPLVNPGEAISGEVRGNFRWIFGWSPVGGTGFYNCEDWAMNDSRM